MIKILSILNSLAEDARKGGLQMQDLYSLYRIPAILAWTDYSDTMPGLQRLPHRAVQILLYGWLAISPLNTSGWVAEMGHWINNTPIPFHECFKTHHVDNVGIASVV